ncbi:MAG: hypothetical protein IPK79_01970 [Vampirovibrionales bacterium]|nr:hypothetical protein [Vampirovibrionales bacterium]
MSTTQPKPKHPQITTPVGVARYPFLLRPHTRFDPDGEYRVTLIIPKAEAQELIDIIDEALKASLEKALADNPAKADKVHPAQPPYALVTNEAGEETGHVRFNFKAKAKIKPRNGAEPFHIKLAIFDAKGQAVSPDVRIGTGTRMKICAEVVPYFTDLVGAGVKLRLKAVQIVDLVEYNGPTASQFGFGMEDGYDSTVTPDEDEAPDDSDF